MLNPEQHRIMRFLAQELVAKRHVVAEGKVISSLGMPSDEVRRHIDELSGDYLEVRRGADPEREDRWLALLPRGEDYVREHGIM
jgi:hypothetical protein